MKRHLNLLTFALPVLVLALIFQFSLLQALISIVLFAFIEYKRILDRHVDIMKSRTDEEEAFDTGIHLFVKDYWWMKTFRKLLAVGNQKQNNIQRIILIILWVPAAVLSEVWSFHYLSILLAVLMIAGAVIGVVHHLVQRYQVKRVRDYVANRTGIYYENLEDVARKIGYYQSNLDL